jgi:hypothetical protein
MILSWTELGIADDEKHNCPGQVDARPQSYDF